MVDATVFLDGDDLTPVYFNESTTLRRAIEVLSYTYVLERCNRALWNQSTRDQLGGSTGAAMISSLFSSRTLAVHT